MSLIILWILVSYGVVTGLIVRQMLIVFEKDIIYVIRKKIRRNVDKRRLTVGMMLLLLYSLIIYAGISDLTRLLFN